MLRYVGNTEFFFNLSKLKNYEVLRTVSQVSDQDSATDASLRTTTLRAAVLADLCFIWVYWPYLVGGKKGGGREFSPAFTCRR